MVNPNSDDWYERNIEEPIRELVKILRNNGINTECSCGHDMYIQCQYTLKNEEESRVYYLVHNYLFENNLSLNFDIECIIRVRDGHMCNYIKIDLNPNRKIKEREEYYALLAEKNNQITKL